MTDDETAGLELPRRSVLTGLGTVGVGSAAAGLGTTALFTDTESFEDNSLTAGTLNLKLGGYVAAANNDRIQIDGSTDDSPTTTTDGPAATAVYSLSDVKPGDLAVPCLRFTIEGNPAYVQVNGSVISDENSVTEPESGPGENDSLGDVSIEGTGELDSKLDIQPLGVVGSTVDESSVSSIQSALSDDSFTATGGNTAFATGETVEIGGAFDVPTNGGTNYTLATDSGPDCFDPGSYYIYFLFDVPTTVGNVIQSDSLTLNLTVRIEQCRNNTNPFSDS